MRVQTFKTAGLGLSFVLGMAVVCLPRYSRGAERSARELLPSTTVGYLEIPQPHKLIDLVLDHPLSREIEKHPDYQKAIQSPDFQKFRELVKLVEGKLGMNWRDALRALGGGGLYVGVDLPTQGLAILNKTADPEFAQKARDVLLELARQDASSKGQPDPVKQADYRGATVHQIGELQYAVFGSWVLTTNKSALLQKVLDNQLDGGKSLAGEEQFTTALKVRQGEPAAWLYVDLRLLKILGAMKGIYDKKSDNPPGELLAGGIVGALADAPYVTASLEADASGVRLSAALPCNPAALAKKREFYFGADGQGAAPPLLKPPGTLFTLTSYRNFVSLWRNAPDLFDDQINAKFAEAEGGLKTLFSGRNFRDEILGNLEPGFRLVAVRQQYPAGGITPAIKLPAVAIVMRMKNPQETGRIFKITYQSLLGFLNVVGGMNGVDPLDQSTEKVGDALVVFAEYLPPKMTDTGAGPGMHFNASPTAVFVGDQFILSSAKPLALELAKLVQATPPDEKAANTAMLLDGPTLRSTLADNRGPLVAQNMLQKGHDQGAAEKEIDALLQVLQTLENVSQNLTANDNLLRLTLELKLRITN